MMSRFPTGLHDTVRVLESADARFNLAWLRAAPPDIAARLGLEIHEIGHALCWVTTGVDAFFANMVVGLGQNEPCTEDTLDAIDALHHRAGSAYGIHLAPTARPPDLARRLVSRGFIPAEQDIRFSRGIQDPPDVHTGLHIEQLGPAEGLLFAAISSAEFPAALPLLPALAATVGRPEWRHYLAFDHDVPVATAAMFLGEGLASFGWAFTLASHRGRGAQTALLTRRIRDAAALGCHTVLAGTFPDTPERPNPSYRNLIHLGFENRYTRQLYTRRRHVKGSGCVRTSRLLLSSSTDGVRRG